MKKNKNKLSKGEYGYINYTKKHQFILSLISFSIPIAIFFLGLALNKWQKNNIFTIIAALAVLPAAKVLIRYILFAPYKTPSAEFHDRVIEVTGDYEGVFFDALVATSEKPLGFDAMVATQHFIICKKSRVGDKGYKMSEALQKLVKGWGHSNKVIVCEDDESFFKELNLKKSEYVPIGTEEEDETAALIKDLRILLP